MADQGLAQILYLRLLDLSPDETLLEIGEAVRRRGARRVVIDSLDGFELAVAPTFRDDFREALYRLAGALTGMGITVLLTREIGQTSTDLHLGLRAASFLVDDVILLRVVEVAGCLKKILVVLKMRGSAHSDEFRLYEITARGLVVRAPLRVYRAAAGVAGSQELTALAYPGLIEPEVVVLQALIELREAPSEAVARRTGLPGPELAAALDRLVGLDYAVRLGRGARAAYRPVARLAG